MMLLSKIRKSSVAHYYIPTDQYDIFASGFNLKKFGLILPLKRAVNDKSLERWEQ